MKQRVVAVVGISGVGKTTFIKRLAEELPIQHLTAGTLIEAGRAIRLLDRDQIRLANINDNQKLLIAGIEQARDESKRFIVMDGHVVIHGPQGLEDLSSQVFSALNVDGMVHLSASPERILRNRVNDGSRDRPILSEQEILDHQLRSIRVAKAICCSVDVPFLEAGNMDINPVKSFFFELP